MEERNDGDHKMEEVMLPGFRFHPTDEELVGFYLKRKIQQRPLSIELIKQLDIYKYDPWDLPKLAATGEKEWYFYCPRDRKYRNSARPNRVTGAGFWKATGTDRPIYSSEGTTKCIGLKKSLVFYKGRAAKGIKTDWMMHEFRLPSLTHSITSPKPIFTHKTIPPNDSWAICRIFKRTNSTAQRALSHSWVSPILPENNTTSHDSLDGLSFSHSTHLSPSITTTEPSSAIQLNYNNEMQHSSPSFSSYKPTNLVNKPSHNHHQHHHLPFSNGDLTSSFMFSPIETSAAAPSRCIVDASSMLLNMSSSILGEFGRFSESNIEFTGSLQENPNSFSMNLPQVMQMINNNGGCGDHHEDGFMMKSSNGAHTDESQLETLRSIGFPFSLPTNVSDSWKPNMMMWPQALTQPSVLVPSEIDI